MGNSTGQRSYALQLLPGERLCLRALEIGDVLGCTRHTKRHALMIPDRLDNAAHIPYFPVWPDDSVLHVYGCAPRTGLSADLHDLLPVFGVHAVQEILQPRWR